MNLNKNSHFTTDKPVFLDENAPVALREKYILDLANDYSSQHPFEVKCVKKVKEQQISNLCKINSSIALWSALFKGEKVTRNWIKGCTLRKSHTSNLLAKVQSFQPLNTWDDSDVEKIHELTIKLPGYGNTSVYTLMHFMYPDEFPIIDEKVVRISRLSDFLAWSTSQANIAKDGTDLIEYLGYRKWVKNHLKKLVNITMRDFDMALFAHHKSVETVNRKINKEKLGQFLVCPQTAQGILTYIQGLNIPEFSPDQLNLLVYYWHNKKKLINAQQKWQWNK
jgi:endonuclease III